MNAVDLLEEQHEEALALMKKLEESEPGAERKNAFRKLQAALTGHMVIEEELFYPRVVEASEKDGEPIAEGYEEHVVARAALARCASCLGSERLFQVRVGVLRELIQHHVKEERGSILPMARKALSKDQLVQLGEAMKQRFERAKGSTTVRADLDRKATVRAQRALSTPA